MEVVTQLQIEIIKTLRKRQSSYANPVPSEEIGRILNVTPSYIREQMGALQNKGWVIVRNGPGGGYFLNPDGEGALNE